MRRTATLMAALAMAFAATAATVRTATENFVTNKIAEAVAAIPSPDYSTNNTELVETIQAEAPAPDFSTNNTALVETIQTKAPTPDLSPFLRSDKSDNEVQIFGGLLSGDGFDIGGDYNINYWTHLSARNKNKLAQTLPEYIESNPWDFQKRGEAITTTTTNALQMQVMQGTLRIDDANGYGKLYLSGKNMFGIEGSSIYFSDSSSGLIINHQGVRVMLPGNFQQGLIEFPTTAGTLALTNDIPTISTWAKAANKPTYTASEVGATTPADVTAAIREQSLGGIWDETLQVWWTPRMRNGSLTYEATTNVNLNAEN